MYAFGRRLGQALSTSVACLSSVTHILWLNGKS